MKRILIVALVLVIYTLNVFSQTPGVKELASKALGKSQQIKICEAKTEKARLDKRKAWEAYLPKVNAEASYTRLNDDIVFPESLQNLLMGTQYLLMQAKLTSSITQIPPIQEKNITKANINAQMLLFSGLKVPYTIKAANHQMAAMQYLTEAERITIIDQVVTTYDKLAVLYQSEQALDNTETLLNEQSRMVDKAYSNGLVINLNRQKIELAFQQVKVKRIELISNKKLLYLKIEELTGYPADSAALLKPELHTWMLDSLSGDVTDRPDIKALDEAIRATDYKRKAELADYTPKVVAFGKKELIKDDLTMLDPEWYVGVGVRWSIFDGFGSQKSARQTKLDRIILENRKSEALELAHLNMKKMIFDMEKYLQLVETAKLQVKLTEDVLKLSKKQFEQGLITLNDHLASVNDYEKAQLDYVQAVAQERASVADYLASCGKLTIDAIQ
jgi:outer membrane protein TolC